VTSYTRMTHQDDQIFIDRTLAGNVNAFATLVDRYKSLVFTLSLRMMKQTEEAEEVAQDVFIKAFQKLGSFKGNSKFSTWLYRITYNACLDALSRKQNQPTHHAAEINDEITEDRVDNILAQLEQEELRTQLEECIQLLPKVDAFLVTLYYLKEQTLAEISVITGLTKNNVKVKIFRSRKKLYEILEARLPEEIKMRYER
jgi:RNA polymerase sigma factor (sigma-70 family)